MKRLLEISVSPAAVGLFLWAAFAFVMTSHIWLEEAPADYLSLSVGVAMVIMFSVWPVFAMLVLKWRDGTEGKFSGHIFRSMGFVAIILSFVWFDIADVNLPDVVSLLMILFCSYFILHLYWSLAVSLTKSQLGGIPKWNFVIGNFILLFYLPITFPWLQRMWKDAL